MWLFASMHFHIQSVCVVPQSYYAYTFLMVTFTLLIYCRLSSSSVWKIHPSPNLLFPCVCVCVCVYGVGGSSRGGSGGLDRSPINCRAHTPFTHTFILICLSYPLFIWNARTWNTTKWDPNRNLNLRSSCSEATVISTAPLCHPHHKM